MNTPTLSKAPSKREAYCPLKMRQLLDLKPGQTDPVSMLLWSAIYGSDSLEDFENSVQESIDQLNKALAIVKAGAK